MSRNVLVLFLFLFSKFIIAQTIIKTNAMNIPLIPSLHIEQGFTKHISVQLNLHRGTITFLSKTDWFNGSLDLRFYIKNYKSRSLSGIYLAPGLHYNFDYNEPIILENQNIVRYGRSNIGPIFRAGYQIVFANERWSLDLGLGLATKMIYLQKSLYSDFDSEFRAMAGLGYRF
ncbi:MAG TPA: DUF3575 domain-containing protein [Saprospiraceae bacterium]|nr:DUF3575 domain-containing protein [Saprospiraceae bacterium]